MDTTSAFISFRDRPAPQPGDRIRVYRNLNRPTLFSIVALDGEFRGKVLGYAPVIGMTDIELKVSDKLRAAVLKKRVRNVHAYASGHFHACVQTLEQACTAEPSRFITYQPYVRSYFFDREAPEVPIWALQIAWSCGANLIAPPTPTT